MEYRYKIDLSLSDLRRALFEKTKKSIRYRIFYLIVFLCFLSSILMFNINQNTENWSVPLGLFSGIAFFLPLIYQHSWTKSYYEKMHLKFKNAWLIFDSTGVRFQSEQLKQEYPWEKVKSISDTKNYLFVDLVSKRFLVLNKKDVNMDEVQKLLIIEKID